jgi:hypothetical protein
MGLETILPAVIGAGASIYGSSKAASAQKGAADQSAALQREIFDKQVELQAPFRAGGLSAQNQLLTLLGLSVPTGDGAIPGLNVDTTSPNFGKYARDFSMADYTADPGYAFRLGEGMKALDASAAARGGLISGAALKAAQNYGQNAASAEYQNAYNRYQTNRTNQLNPLLSLMGAGQTSANTLSSAAGNYATNAGNAAIAAGNAQASGYLNSTNAINNALTQGMSSYAANRGSPYGGYGGYGGGNSWLTDSLLNNPLGY